MTDTSVSDSRINLNDLIKERRSRNPIRVVIYIDRKLAEKATELFDNQDSTFQDFSRRIYRQGIEDEQKKQNLKRK